MTDLMSETSKTEDHITKGVVRESVYMGNDDMCMLDAHNELIFGPHMPYITIVIWLIIMN